MELPPSYRPDDTPRLGARCSIFEGLPAQGDDISRPPWDERLGMSALAGGR